MKALTEYISEKNNLISTSIVRLEVFNGTLQDTIDELRTIARLSLVVSQEAYKEIDRLNALREA